MIDPLPMLMKTGDFCDAASSVLPDRSWIVLGDEGSAFTIKSHSFKNATRSPVKILSKC